MAAAPSMTTAAIKNRAVRRISGGQSNSASLAAENAELHSRQNIATSTGSGIEVAEKGRVATAEGIGISTRLLRTV
jgi:hypothetical protein